jgi:hypothetical protein
MKILMLKVCIFECANKGAPNLSDVFYLRAPPLLEPLTYLANSSRPRFADSIPSWSGALDTVDHSEESKSGTY